MRLAAIDSLKNEHVWLVTLDRRKGYSQEGNDRGKTLWYERDKNGDCESDTTSRLAFIRRGYTNDKEDNCEENGDC